MFASPVEYRAVPSGWTGAHLRSLFCLGKSITCVPFEPSPARVMSGSGATAAISPSPLQITCLVYAFMGNSKQMSYGPETVAAMLVGTFPFCSPRILFLYIIIYNF
jgi:hypothetical protein